MGVKRKLVLKQMVCLASSYCILSFGSMVLVMDQYFNRSLEVTETVQTCSEAILTLCANASMFIETHIVLSFSCITFHCLKCLKWMNKSFWVIGLLCLIVSGLDFYLRWSMTFTFTSYTPFESAPFEFNADLLGSWEFFCVGGFCLSLHTINVIAGLRSPGVVMKLFTRRAVLFMTGFSVTWMPLAVVWALQVTQQPRKDPSWYS